MEETTGKTSTPPYLAFKTLTNFIVAFRQSGLPGRIDRTLMAGQSGATQSSLMQTLKFLALIQENGSPTPALVQLVEHPETEAKQYADLVKKSYGFVFNSGINLETATDGQLQEVFRTAGLGGDTVRKAMTFFVMMAEAGGIKISPHVKSGKNKTMNSGSTITRPRRRRAVNQDEDSDEESSTAHQEAEGTKTHVLPLNVEGDRIITVTAPLDLSAKEINRIKKWLEITLLIEGEAE